MVTWLFFSVQPQQHGRGINVPHNPDKIFSPSEASCHFHSCLIPFLARPLSCLYLSFHRSFVEFHFTQTETLKLSPANNCKEQMENWWTWPIVRSRYERASALTCMWVWLGVICIYAYVLHQKWVRTSPTPAAAAAAAALGFVNHASRRLRWGSHSFTTPVSKHTVRGLQHNCGAHFHTVKPASFPISLKCWTAGPHLTSMDLTGPQTNRQNHLG